MPSVFNSNIHSIRLTLLLMRVGGLPRGTTVGGGFAKNDKADAIATSARIDFQSRIKLNPSVCSKQNTRTNVATTHVQSVHTTTRHGNVTATEYCIEVSKYRCRTFL